MCQHDERCITEGLELSYESGCLSFAVAHGGAEAAGLSDSEFELAIWRAFERWRSVDCGGGKGAGFLVESAGIVLADSRSFCPSDGRANTSVFFLASEWDESRTSSSTIGFTYLSYVSSSGLILDADVEVNADRFNREDPEAGAILLDTILTHEIGHLLGLAHSDVSTAVMAATYRSNDTSLELSQDDIDGICAVFAPARTPTQCPVPRVRDTGLSEESCAAHAQPRERTSATCEVATTTSGSTGLEVLWVGSLLGLFRIRRRYHGADHTRVNTARADDSVEHS